MAQLSNQMSCEDPMIVSCMLNFFLEDGGTFFSATRNEFPLKRVND